MEKHQLNYDHQVNIKLKTSTKLRIYSIKLSRRNRATIPKNDCMPTQRTIQNTADHVTYSKNGQKKQKIQVVVEAV